MKIKKRYEKILEKWVLSGLEKQQEKEVVLKNYRGISTVFLNAQGNNYSDWNYYSVMDFIDSKSERRYEYYLSGMNIFKILNALKLNKISNNLKDILNKKYRKALERREKRENEGQIFKDIREDV